jgi:uncharacterized membrane protein YecN with MAPEG domain
MQNLIPISTLFIGLNGFVAFVLSYIVVMERTSTRVWHGESKQDIAAQPDYLEKPNAWATFIESYTQKSVTAKTSDDGLLQRKVRAYGNFTEYVPLALLFLVALELMHSRIWLLWLLGIALTVGRVAHAWGVISTYGPSPSRAVGFFLTWLVYIVGAGACVYYGVVGLL